MKEKVKPNPSEMITKVIRHLDLAWTILTMVKIQRKPKGWGGGGGRTNHPRVNNLACAWVTSGSPLSQFSADL